MKCWMYCFLYAGMMLVFSNAQGALLYTSGHADIGLGFHDGGPEFHFHAEDACIGGVPDVSGEFEPDAILVVVPDHVMTILSGGSSWAFTGTTAGSPIWILPQHHGADGHGHEDEDMPFLGIGTEEIPSGLFVGNQVSLTLGSISGPGHFSLWQTDPFGEPIVYMSSFDPASANVLVLPVGLHGHYNWGFTEPGLYQIELIASGLLLDQTQTTISGVFSFLVVPEPSSLLFLTLGRLALSRKW